MSGNVLLNGKKRRLDYGVLVSYLFTYNHECVHICISSYIVFIETRNRSMLLISVLTPIQNWF